MSYSSAMQAAASERAAEGDGVTIRPIENEKIVPGEYDGDDAMPASSGERNQDVRGPSVVRAWASEFG